MSVKNEVKTAFTDAAVRSAENDGWSRKDAVRVTRAVSSYQIDQLVSSFLSDRKTGDFSTSFGMAVEAFGEHEVQTVTDVFAGLVGKETAEKLTAA